MTDLIELIAPPAATDGPRRVLHVGCGMASVGKLDPIFRTAAWREIRLDIDPEVKPDIVADMMDALWSSHNIEHLYAHQVPVALAEFFRVLKPGGRAMLQCPDIERVARAILEGGLDQAVYSSPSGDITPHDMMFGFGRAVAAGNDFMAHKTAFTGKTLGKALVAAGFAQVHVKRREFDLVALAIKPQA